MTDWPREAVARLAAAVKERRDQLGLTQIQVWEAGGPSNSTLTAIEGASQSVISTATLRKLDTGLGWAPGTAVRILSGGDHSVRLDIVPTDDLLAEIRRRIPDQREDWAGDWGDSPEEPGVDRSQHG
jgi:hypothetical protein